MSALPSPAVGRRRRIGQYSRKDKLVAVVAAETMGTAEAARALKVSYGTLRAWTDDDELRPYVETARRQIMGDVTSVAQKAWGEMLVRLSNDAESFSARDLLMVAAESTTKMQLLGGGATARTESYNIIEHFDDTEAQELVNRARRYLAGHGPRARQALAVGPGLEVPAPEESDPA